MIARPDVLQGPRYSWQLRGLLYTASAAVGGASSGIVVAALGGWFAVEVRLVTATLGAAAILAVGVLGVLQRTPPLIQCSRETPRSWMRLGELPAAMANGLALGCGATTRIGFAVWYTVAASAFLLGDPLKGALIYGAYGAARGLAVWAFALARHVFTSAEVARDDGVASWALSRRNLANDIGSVHLIILGFAALVIQA